MDDSQLKFSFFNLKVTNQEFTVNVIRDGIRKYSTIQDVVTKDVIYKSPTYTSTPSNPISDKTIGYLAIYFLFEPAPTVNYENIVTSIQNNILIDDNTLALPNNVIITKEYLAPEPQATPVPTPKEVNAQTQKETDKKQEEQAVTDNSQSNSQVIEQNTPTTLKPSSKEKIAKTIKSKDNEIKNILIKTVIALLVSVGAKYLNSRLVLPEACASESTTDRAIKNRNQVVIKLNSITKILNTISLILTGLTLAASIYKSLTKTTKTLYEGLKLSTTPIPAPPGTPGANVSTLHTLKDNNENSQDNLDKIISTLATINLYLASLNATLLTIISLLNQLDQYIKKCAPNAELIPLSPILLEIQQTNQTQEIPSTITYNGFILEIEEIQFTSTVNKRRAVGKNKDNIVLIATPYSFTTLNDVLINELKLIIDSNNLKVD